MVHRTSDFEREMQVLEAELKRLEAEYSMFFAGQLPRLPWETRTRVQALVKKHDRSPPRNTAQRFRFGTLQARYASFCELWDRNLKMREEGRSTSQRRRGPAPGPGEAETPARAAPASPTSAGGHGARLRDPARESARLKALYDQVAAAREAAGARPMPFQRFAEVVRTQVDKLGRGEREVMFRVVVKDGKVMLTAKPVK